MNFIHLLILLISIVKSISIIFLWLDLPPLFGFILYSSESNIPYSVFLQLIYSHSSRMNSTVSHPDIFLKLKLSRNDLFFFSSIKSWNGSRGTGNTKTICLWYSIYKYTYIYIYLAIILDWHGQSRYVCTYIFAMNTENNEEFVNIDTSLYLEWSNPILLIVKTNSWRTNISTVNAISNI